MLILALLTGLAALAWLYLITCHGGYWLTGQRLPDKRLPDKRIPRGVETRRAGLR